MHRAKYHTELNTWKLWRHPIPLFLLLKLGHTAAKKKKKIKGKSKTDHTEKLGCTAWGSAVMTTEPVLLLEIRRALNLGHPL